MFELREEAVRGAKSGQTIGSDAGKLGIADRKVNTLGKVQAFGRSGEGPGQARQWGAG